MATIIAYPAAPAAAHQCRVSPRVGLGKIFTLAAAPLLAIGLAIGMLDAVAFTQSSLMGLYSTVSPALSSTGA